MNSPQNKSSEILWQLSGCNAQLHVDSLAAKLNLQHPSLGLGRIAWDSLPQSGSVLGIGFAKDSAERDLSIGEGFDCFVRGTDLVARYPETDEQSFTLEVYWRVESMQSCRVQIDAIVSLQTSLLECYPAAQTISNLRATQAWLVPDVGARARQISPGEQLTSDEFAGVLLRDTVASWSYLEMTHPEDLGTWQATDVEADEWNLQRTLGGEFQEKGVIRRMRVRGIFLPREGDLELAPQLLNEFADSPPPLTA